MTWLVVSEVFPPMTGGSGRYYWEIYRRQPRADVVVAAGEDPRQEGFDRSHDLRVHRLPLALPSWGVQSPDSLKRYWRAIRALRRIIKTEHVTGLHCGRCLPEGLMARALRFWTGLPYLCYVHGEEMNYASGSRELSWLARRVLGAASLVIASSRNAERILRDEWHVPAERIRVLHPGVDCGRFVPAPRDPAVRSRLGWHDRPVIVTAGRLQKRKGHDMMILALRQIRQAVPDVLYAIVGDGEERASLQALATHHGLDAHVQFLGEIDDRGLIECYQQCDLFVLPNRQVGKDIEGFGMVLLEAQACGKPVVAGASGGTAETMNIPETGRVVPCEHPDELAVLVRDLLADAPRRARMGEAARRWVVDHFDWAALSQQAQQIYANGTGAPQPSSTG